MKDYFIDDEQKGIRVEDLRAEFLPLPEYAHAHKHLIISCHDVLVEYQGGIILTKRQTAPLQGEYCFLGGRILRGIPTVESLRRKVRDEAGLEIENIEFLTVGRTFYSGEPFGHAKGTDTLNLVFFARGRGQLTLNQEHSDVKIITPLDYTPEFRQTLDPYVRDMMDLGIRRLQQK